MVALVGTPSSGMRVYLAGRYSRREELRGYAQALAQSGVGTADIAWLREEHDWDGTEGEEGLAQAQRFAIDDMQDLASAHAVVVWSEAPGGCRRGGRHVEYGVALGMGKHVVVVGPLENVFYSLPSVPRFLTWDGALAHLAVWKAEVERAARVATIVRPT